MNSPDLVGPQPARRDFLRQIALASLLAKSVGASSPGSANAALANLLPQLPRPVARARRVIFLAQSGAPSQLDLFDPKPGLTGRDGEELPESIRQGQILTTMTANQATKPIVSSPYNFRRYGQSGAQFSELLPHLARVADDLCIVRSLHTEAINHDPGITFLQTGSQQPGRPSMGSWLSYGLGSENEDLPTFTVMISGGEPLDQPLHGRLWGTAFLPTDHQGVRLRGGSQAVSYLPDPAGISPRMRRRLLDRLAELDDPAAPFELAFRMQQAIPELLDLRQESARSLQMYGPDVQVPGSFAANCLLARRMAERGVRFIQLFHRGWDHHAHLPTKLPKKCQQVDQPSAALVHDLKQRGLLDDTLIIWAGEFGRTVYCQGEFKENDFGRDHHPRCFTIWMAGGGVNAGNTIGKTDEFSYNVVADPVHIHDLHATVLHLLGIDHTQLTYRYQSRDYRLTDIAGQVIPKLLR
ncbi:MAG: DUF1501 domain-containing protein [Planctomycetota bacterium]